MGRPGNIPDEPAHHPEQSKRRSERAGNGVEHARPSQPPAREPHRGGERLGSILGYLKELSDKGCGCVDVKGLRVEAGALANGTLGGFTIVYYGQLCLPIDGAKGYWKFTGKMQFYDYWNFESHAGKNTQRSVRGEGDVRTAQKWILGRPFSVYSVAVDAMETSTSGETIWNGMGGAAGAFDFNRRNAGDLR